MRISRHQLRERVRRIEICLSKLSTTQIWSRQHEIENAIGNLVLHLAGNVRQWIVCGIGGEEDRRDRDAEFSHRDSLPAAEILARLRQAVDEADAVLDRLSGRDLLARHRIQVYEVTALHAVYHVVEHFAEHTGQIVWATKRMTGEDLRFYSYLKEETAPTPGGSPMP